LGLRIVEAKEARGFAVDKYEYRSEKFKGALSRTMSYPQYDVEELWTKNIHCHLVSHCVREHEFN